VLAILVVIAVVVSSFVLFFETGAPLSIQSPILPFVNTTADPNTEYISTA
jgi:hypothetical protein